MAYELSDKHGVIDAYATIDEALRQLRALVNTDPKNLRVGDYKVRQASERDDDEN